jgi:hypothetical protein
VELVVWGQIRFICSLESKKLLSIFGYSRVEVFEDLEDVEPDLFKDLCKSISVLIRPVRR